MRRLNKQMQLIILSIIILLLGYFLYAYLNFGPNQLRPRIIQFKDDDAIAYFEDHQKTMEEIVLKAINGEFQIINFDDTLIKIATEKSPSFDRLEKNWPKIIKVLKLPLQYRHFSRRGELLLFEKDGVIAIIFVQNFNDNNSEPPPLYAPNGFLYKSDGLPNVFDSQVGYTLKVRLNENWFCS